ncbi:MAG: hypothetical protein ACHQLQ_07725 [Candidatus Acidiferrales bacterium]
MSTSHGKFTPENKRGHQRRVVIARALWPRLIELWISAVLVVFFLIRVLGSHTAQRILSGLQRHRIP